MAGYYTEEGWRAVRVHLDGYPEGLGPDLLCAAARRRRAAAWPCRPHAPDEVEDEIYSHDARRADVARVYLFSLGDRRLDVARGGADVIPFVSVDLDSDAAQRGPGAVTRAHLRPLHPHFHRQVPEALLALVAALLDGLAAGARVCSLGAHPDRKGGRNLRVGDRTVVLDRNGGSQALVRGGRVGSGARAFPKSSGDGGPSIPGQRSHTAANTWPHPSVG